MEDEDKNKGDLADRVRAALESRGMSQQALERAADLPRGYVSRILSRQRKALSPKVVERIAKSLELDYEWLAVGAAPTAADIDVPERVSIDAPLEVEWGELIDYMAARFRGFSKAVQAARLLDIGEYAVFSVARDARYSALSDQSARWWLQQFFAKEEYVAALRTKKAIEIHNAEYARREAAGDPTIERQKARLAEIVEARRKGPPSS